MASTTVWKGHLTFGLVSIPLRLYAAARTQRIELHQLHKKCRTRLRRPLFCPTCNRIVEPSEVVKGYEYEKGQYLLVENQELKKLAPQAGEAMEIEGFVPLAEIDPLYYDASYFAVPEKSGQRAYRLLVETMQETGKAALAKMVMHQREYVVVIRTRDQGLTLHTLYFADEIREAPEYGRAEGEVKPQEVKLAKDLVATLSTHFNPDKYHDEYQARLKKLLDAKSKGKPLPVIAERKLAPVVDIVDALKKSVAERQGKGGRAVETASRRGARRKAG